MIFSKIDVFFVDRPVKKRSEDFEWSTNTESEDESEKKKEKKKEKDDDFGNQANHELTGSGMFLSNFKHSCFL